MQFLYFARTTFLVDPNILLADDLNSLHCCHMKSVRKIFELLNQHTNVNMEQGPIGCAA
jgi:hypothetical protein